MRIDTRVVLLLSLVLACNSKKSIGGACSNTAECTAGAFCLSQVCARAAECSATAACTGALVCESGLCVPKSGNVAGGSACGANFDCMAGLTCSNGVCGSATLAAVPVVTEVSGDGATPDKVSSGIVVSGDHLETVTTVELLSTALAPISNLVIKTATATTLTASLPNGVSPGSYVLKVSSSLGSATRELSLLKGDTGAMGAPGANGSIGPMGPTGERGPTGSISNAITGASEQASSTSDTKTAVVRIYYPGLTYDGNEGLSNALMLESKGSGMLINLLGPQEYNSSLSGDARFYLGDAVTDRQFIVGQIARDKDGDGTIESSETDRVFRISATGVYHQGNSDIAEYVPSTGALAPGYLVEIDPSGAAMMRQTQGKYSIRVAGVVSREPGIVLGDKELNEPGANRNQSLVALRGRVPVWVNGEGGPVSPGDMLTSSSEPGVAMRCPSPMKCVGATLGKAMDKATFKDGEKKQLMVWVNLQ